jgi:cbb3-type cytochrome oxidase maturation protein
MQRVSHGVPRWTDGGGLMDILFLLIPVSVGLVLLVLAALWWAVDRGQFEDIEREGHRILRDD